MNVAVPKEITAGERRVALVPDGAQKLAAGKLSVLVQSGAGRPAFFPDEAYEKAGARLVPDAATAYTDGNALLKVQPPTLDRKSTRLNSSHRCISYAVFCLKKT